MDSTTPTSTPPQPVKYAGFWVRLLAFLVDAIILGIIGFLIFGPEVVQINTANGLNIELSYQGWRNIVPLLYYFLFWTFLSATPGKMALGLKIIDQNGNKLTWKNSLLRIIGFMISAIPLFLGFIWIAFDSEKQGWHDKIAKTHVVKR